SAVGNVSYGMNGPTTSRERRIRAWQLLDRFKVGHLADRRPGTYSGGEAQRVALARALGMSPRVVLMDEPFSAMDQRLRGELVRDVRSLVEELAVPTVFVTHHRGEARALGEHGVLIELGRIVKSGRVSDVIPAEEVLDA